MDPLTIGALITGGGSLLSSIFNSSTSASNTQAQIQAQNQMQQQSQQFNADQANITRDWSANQANIQRDYQTSMSNTAYQRSREDMQKAGLNPILAAGTGGSTTPAGAMPSGATASTSTPQSPDFSKRTHPLAGLGESISKVVSTAVQAKTFERMTQEIANLKADEAKRKSEDITERMRPAEIAARVGYQEAETRKSQADLPVHVQRGHSAKNLDHINKDIRVGADVGAFLGSKINDTIAPLTNTARSAIQYLPKKSTRGGLRENDRGEWSTFEEMHKSRIGF